ncbi:helix-turn-helix domain-containing protein [Nocardia beijingensis]|uniref:helix-turn-helix domain-containing protein n=1 Tax=Nocardia beijingensis TaxID=95162 RepID=UPI0018942FB7|nr:helix-turn-helix domain-containing protein [Nocardia beijingensis]MBF6466689.1 helix-turn-helix domain-containing protein [Nocardia beijingensis]
MIVSKWTKVEVKALRLAALRLTQEQFAERVGFTTATIRKWERANYEKPVRNESAEALDTELARLTDEQRARFRAELNDVREAAVSPNRWLPAGSANDSLGMHTDDQRGATEIEVDVKRREFGMLLGAVFLAASGDTDAGPIRIGVADARRLNDFAAYLGRREQDIGGASLVETAVQALETAKQLLDTCAFSEEAGREFIKATGELATIAGWLAYDSDRYSLARRCYADAFSLANQAGDDPLTVHVCMNAALLAVSRLRNEEASPHRALSLAGRARQLARGHAHGPSRIHALIATREAQAYGILGDRAAYRKAIATAWREFDFAVDHESREDCPPWLRFVNATEIRYHEARAHGRLGYHAKSAELYNGLALEQAGARNSASYRAGAATALVKSGDVDAGVEQGLSVLADLEGSVSSTRILRRLEPVRAAAEGRSEEFATRFDALAGREVTA